jgi:aldehyde:ferredoxin oxidoreductase
MLVMGGDPVPAVGSGVEVLRTAGDGLPRVELHPAMDLWGRDVPTTMVILRQRFAQHEAAIIGPAGERGVLFASIASSRGRQVGRGGLGAVMGAKRLKAIVLHPGRASLPPAADQQSFEVVVKEATRLLRANPITARTLPQYGTSVLVSLMNALGAMPTRNFRDSRFEFADAISGEALLRGGSKKGSACHGCFVGCARSSSGDGHGGKGPEYEGLWSLGADCGVADLAAVLDANAVCNKAGVDVITMGATIACAMELTEVGALRGGPRFGDPAALSDLVRATSRRSGLGDELAEGSARFAARHGMPELSMSVKGLEMPAFDPRGMTGQGLAYATSNRGACHVRANMLGPEVLGIPMAIDRFATSGKAGVLIKMQNLNAVLDSLVICKFSAFVLDEHHYAHLVSAMLGVTMDRQELLAIGDHIWNLERLFNLRAGFTRADDTLPRRMLEEPVASGPSAGHVVDLGPMLREYYLARNWGADGRPQ